MPTEENSEAGLRRRRILLSATAIAFGVLMLVAIPTDFGPLFVSRDSFRSFFYRVRWRKTLQGFAGLRSVRPVAGLLRI